MKNKKIWVLLLSIPLLWNGCGGSSSSGSDNGGGGGSSCADGDNDFYVVENASCEVDAGKLSRINPDEDCKETILSGLDCPVDFVLSSDGTIGYLSERTNNGIDEFGNQPGNIYQVDVSAGTKTLINSEDGIPQSFVSPSGLALMEDLTSDEKEEYCSNDLSSDILFVADQEAENEGTVWMICINSAGLEESSLQTAASTAEVDNPRGVAILDRFYLLITDAVDADDDGTPDTGEVLFKVIPGLSSDEQAAVLNDSFSINIKDMAIDIDGSILVVDAVSDDTSGDGEIVILDTEGSITGGVAGFDGPRDVLALGPDSDEINQYLVSLFMDDVIAQSSLLADTDILDAAEGLTLNGPDGMAQ